MKIIDQTVKKIRETFPDVIAIYSFGSYGTEFETPQSDVDLAILTRDKIEKVMLWELAQEIAMRIDKDVDLIDLTQASTVLSFQVLNEGKRIYCKDKHRCDTFENVVDSEYLNFRQLRADLIKDIKQRGRITNG